MVVHNMPTGLSQAGTPSNCCTGEKPTEHFHDMIRIRKLEHSLRRHCSLQLDGSSVFLISAKKPLPNQPSLADRFPQIAMPHLDNLNSSEAPRLLKSLFGARFSFTCAGIASSSHCKQQPGQTFCMLQNKSMQCIA